ncbi:MAG TPA: PHP domain-containing protein, partial [Dongiaceae bacterium]|nr:PHP domain-containing protein [Dongiaceae bacterium]
MMRAAHEAGLDAVAICDHNAAENVGAAVRAGLAARVAVIPGMEITSEEEAHIVALLPDVEAAERLQAAVYADLPGENDERAFGSQVIVDEAGEVLGFNQHLLIGATRWSVEHVVEAVHRERGLAIAAHVDRERFGL